MERFVTNDPDDGFAYISAILGRRAELVDYSNFRLVIETTPLELLTVNVFELSAGMRARSTNVRRYALSLIDRSGVERSWNHRPPIFAGPGDAILDTPENETETRAFGVRFTTVSIPPYLIEEEARNLIGDEVIGALEIHRAIDSGPLLALMNDLIVAAGEGNSPFRQDLERKLITSLILDTPNSYTKLLDGKSGSPAKRYVSTLIEYLGENLKRSVTLGDMAGAAGVSKRRLIASCRAGDYAPPMAMLREMRLHAIRARLERPLPGETIYTVAGEYCFGHMSNFARYYYRLFNETPRETLRRGRRKNGIARPPAP